MTSIYKLNVQLEELTTKLLRVSDLQSPEAQKIAKRIKAVQRKIEAAQ